MQGTERLLWVGQPGKLLPGNGNVHSPSETSAVGVLPSGRKQVMRDTRLGLSGGIS